MGWKIASQKLKLQKKEQEKEPKSLIELIEIIPNDITNIKNIFMLWKCNLTQCYCHTKVKLVHQILYPTNIRTQHKNTTQDRHKLSKVHWIDWSYCWCCCITYIHSQLCGVLWYTPYKNQWIKLSILVLFKYDITEKVLEMQYNIAIQWMDWIVCTFFILALLDSFILSFYQL